MQTNNGLDNEDPKVQSCLNVLTQKLEKSSNATAKRNDLYGLSVKLSEPIVARDPFKFIIVTIGRVRSLQMQEQKYGYMNSLLSRSNLVASSGTQGKNALLKACVQAVVDLENEVRLWYADIDNFTHFVEMYVLDGCFILELLIRYYTVFKLHLRLDCHDNPLFKPAEDQDEYPIFKFNWILSAVRCDLALLQNQMSFVILQKIFELITGRDNNLPHDFLVELASQFFQPVHQQENPSVPVIDRTLHRAHLLNVLLNVFRPTTESEAASRNGRSRNNRVQSTPRKTFIQSATSLEQVGVRFIPGSTGSLLDICFQERQGAFEIPTLQITAWTNSFFRNLMAFERCCPDRKPYVASYLLLMSRLINNSEDVRLLERRGILINDIGSDKDVLDMFKSIGRQIDVQDFYYQQLCDYVNSSYSTMWNRYTKELQNRYFKSPWVIIGVNAAVIMIILMFLQTIYAVFTYYKL